MNDKKQVEKVVARVEIKIPYNTIPQPRVEGEKTRTANSKSNTSGSLRETFSIQTAIPLDELKIRLKNAIAILNTGSEAKDDTIKKIEAQLKRDFMLREEQFKKDVKISVLAEIEDIKKAHVKEVTELKEYIEKQAKTVTPKTPKAKK
jgi:hypothetical protein